MKFNIKNLTKADYLKMVIPLGYGLLHYFIRPGNLGSIFYVLGWYLGMLILVLDKNYFYKYYFESIHLKGDKFARLVTRSILFIFTYFGLSIFLITSSGSNFGIGIIMGIGLVLGFEMWNSRTYTDFFNQYFIQSKKKWIGKEIDVFVKVFLVFYLFISIFSVI